MAKIRNTRQFKLIKTIIIVILSGLSIWLIAPPVRDFIVEKLGQAWSIVIGLLLLIFLISFGLYSTPSKFSKMAKKNKRKRR